MKFMFVRIGDYHHLTVANDADADADITLESVGCRR